MKNSSPTDLKIGDYVIATKFADGDPHDHWAIGYFNGKFEYPHSPARYDIVDADGKQFRSNGFRRIKKITQRRGAWLLENAKDIEFSGKSVWGYVNGPMRLK